MTDLTVELTRFFSQFHFIRPYWLLVMPLAFAWYLFSRKRRQARGQWQALVDPELQEAVIEHQAGQRDRLSQIGLLLVMLLAALALAGPAWQKLPQPVVKNEDTLIILQDMSYSMAAEDVSPSRAERALQKVTDILKARRDGQTAMVSYAGEAYTVTPLTTDNDTILNLLTSLSPFMMPAPGSRPDRAIELAQQLAANAGVQSATLLLITDGILEKDIERIDQALDEHHFELKIITVGTREGAPIPLPTSGFLKDSRGGLIIPTLDTAPFEHLQQRLGVPWRHISLLDDDWQSLLSTRPVVNQNDVNDQPETMFDQWKDQGYWLILLILPIALLSFRRGLLFSLVFLIPMLHTEPAAAFEWQDLWKTPDQQASELLQQDPASAASRFENPGWKGTAAYQSGDYEQAAKAFEQDQSPRGHYNRGNALAQAGQLEQALKAYDQALASNPDDEDAAYNRKLVEDALKKQQEQQQNQKNPDQKNQKQQNQDGSDSDDASDSQQNQQNQQSDQSQNSSDQNSSDQNQSGQNQDSQSSDSRSDGQSDSQKDNPNQNGQSSDPSSEDQPSKDQASKQQQAQSKQREQEENGNQGNATELNAQNAKDAESGEAQGQMLDSLDANEQMQLKQWLNRVPDQPGKLLERKFLYQYSQQANQNEPEEQVW